MKKILGGILERFISSLDISSNGALKRLLMILLTMAVPAINRRLGLGLDVTEVLGVILAGVAYVWQSGAKAKVLAGIQGWEQETPAPTRPAPVVTPAAAEPAAVTEGTRSPSDDPGVG
jgi:hypothetical protein